MANWISSDSQVRSHLGKSLALSLLIAGVWPMAAMAEEISAALLKPTETLGDIGADSVPLEAPPASATKITAAYISPPSDFQLALDPADAIPENFLSPLPQEESVTKSPETAPLVSVHPQLQPSPNALQDQPATEQLPQTLDATNPITDPPPRTLAEAGWTTAPQVVATNQGTTLSSSATEVTSQPLAQAEPDSLTDTKTDEASETPTDRNTEANTPTNLGIPYFVDTEFRGNTRRQFGGINLRLPFWQDAQSFAFADVHFEGGSNETFLGNLGLAYRRVLNTSEENPWILGTHAFYDSKRSENGFQYHQGSLGAELVNKKFEFRVNGYLPGSNPNVVGQRTVNGVLGIQPRANGLGTNIVQQTLTLEARERALAGFDFEAGHRHHFNDQVSLGLFGGYFFFDSSETLSIDGPMARAQLEVQDPLGMNGGLLQVGGRFRFDETRGSELEGFVRLGIPFGGPKRSQPLTLTQRLARRPIEREYEITTFAQDINRPISMDALQAAAAGQGTLSPLGPQIIAATSQVALDPATRLPVNIFFIDGNGTTGSGTQGNPLTIAQADALTQANDVLFFLNDAGAIDTQTGTGGTLSLKEGQQALGVGITPNFVFTVPNLGSVTVFDTGQPQLINGANNNVLTLANNNTIDGLAFNGQNTSPRGIAAVTGATNTTIRNSSFSNFTIAGIQITPSTNTTIDNVVFNNNATDAIVNAANTTLTNVVSTNATGPAIQILNATGTTTLTNVDISNSGGDGLQFANPSGTITATNVDITNAGDNSIDIAGGDGTFTFDDTSSITNATSSAFNIVGGTTTVTYNGTITQNNPASAVNIADKTGGITTFNGLVTANTSTAPGVNLTNNAGSTVAFNGGLDIDTTTGTGFNATNGGTVNVAATAANESVTTTAGTAINLNGVTANITFDSVSSTGGTNGINLDTVTGSVGVSGTTTIANATGDGFLAANSTGIYTFGPMEITNAGDNGIDITGGDGTFTFDATSSITNATNAAFNVVGGTSTITYNGTITQNNPASAINITDKTVGTTTFNGLVTANTSTAPGVNLTNNTGSTIAFNGGLDIDTTTGIGFNATNGGTVNVMATGGDKSITTTSGTALNLNGITANITFDSVSSTGGTNGINLDTVTGSVGVSGSTTIVNATGDGFLATNSTGTYTFGLTTITNAGVDGLDLSGINDATTVFNFGALTINGFTGAGINLAGANVGVTAPTVAITNTGNVGTGIDLSDTTGNQVITLGDPTNTAGDTPSSIAGVNVGVQLNNANANFTFGDGEQMTDALSTIAATTPLDVSGLGATGTYNFLDVAFAGNPGLGFTFPDVFFVDQNTNGTGATITDPGSIANAEASATADVFILINTSGTDVIDAINAGGTFDLTANQQILSFRNGSTINIPFAGPGNVLLNASTGTVTDTTGNGAPTLTTTGAGTPATVAFANNNTINGVVLDNGSNGSAVSGTGLAGTATIQQSTVPTVDFNGGTVNVNITGSTLNNGNPLATINVNGGHTGALTVDAATTINATNGTGLQFDNADGTYTFNGPITLNGGDAGIDILNGSAGTFTFANSTITNPTGIAYNEDTSTATVAYTGTITQNNAASAVNINNKTGGSTTFNGLVTANTSTVTGINLTNNTGGTINFNGGLDIDTTTGIGFSATGGSTVNGTGTNSITITGAAANTLKLANIEIGGSGLNFDTIQATGTGANALTADGIDIDDVTGGTFNGGAVTIAQTTGAGDGINITNSSAAFNFSSATLDNTGDDGIELSGANGNITFATVDIDGTNDRGISILNPTNNVNINSGTLGAVAPISNGFGFLIQNQAAGSTIVTNNLAVSTSGSDAYALTNNVGTINILSGSATHSGVSDALDITNGSATVNFGADIVHTFNGSQAVEIDGTSGNITISGTVTATNSSPAVNIGGNSAILDGQILFTGSTISSTNSTGTGISIQNVNAGASVDVSAGTTVTVTNPAAAGINLQNNAGVIAFNGPTTISDSGGDAITITNNAGAHTFGAVTITNPGTVGIDIEGTNGALTFGNVDITGLGGDDGVDFNGATLAGAINFNSLDITGTGVANSVGIDLTGVAGNQVVQIGLNTGTDNLTDPGSNIINVQRGVAIDNTAAVQFTFGDGFNPETGSTIDVANIAGAFTVDAGNGTLAASNYDFEDVTVGSGDVANFPAAPNSAIFVSTTGGTVANGTNGLSQAVPTLTVAAAEALANSGQTFVFVGDPLGSIDVTSGGTDGLTLQAGQSLNGFNNGNTITFGTLQPANILGNLGAIGGTVTANSAVATNSNAAATSVVTGIGNNTIANNIFDGTGATTSLINVTGATATTTLNGVDLQNISTGRAGVNLDNNSAAVTLTDVDLIGAGNSGTALQIDATTASTAPITVDANSDIDGTTGTVLSVGAGARNVNLSAVNITAANNTSNVIDITGQTGGTISFGTVGITGFNNATGTAVNAAGTGGTLSLAELDITATDGDALAVDQQTLSITNVDNDIIANSGQALDFAGTAITAGGLTLDQVTSNASGAEGIDIDNTSGGTLTVNRGDIDNATGDGINITNADNITNFSNVDIDNVGGNGIAIADNNTTGSFTLSGTNTIDQTSGDGINISGATASISNVTIGGTTAPGSDGVDVRDNGQDINLTLNSITVANTGATGTGILVDGSGAGSVTLNAFTGNTVTDAAVNGINITDATFDADPVTAGIQQVTGGDISVGTLGNRVEGDGIRLNNVLGNIAFSNMTVFNNNGTGLFVRDAAGKGGTFTFSAAGGTIDTTNGSAIDIDPVLANLTFDTVLSTNANGQGSSAATAGGIFLDGVDAQSGPTANAFTATTVNISGATNDGINILNSTGTFTFGTTTINNSTTTGGGIEVTPGAGDNTTVNFTNGLDIDTSTGIGFRANGTAGTAPTVNVTNAGIETINTTNGTALDFDNVTLATSFDSVSATHSSGSGIQLDAITGTLNISGGTLTNTGPGTAFDMGSTTNNSGGNATVTYAGNIINTNNSGRSVLIEELAGGTINLNGNITDSGAGIRVRALNNGVPSTVNFAGTLDIDNDVTNGIGMDLGSTGANNNGTINLTGNLDIDTQNNARGLVARGGTLNVTGANNNIDSATGTALELNGINIGTNNIALATVDKNSPGGTNEGIDIDSVTGGTLNIASSTIVGTTGAINGIDIDSSAATFNFGSATIDNTGGAGINLNGANGTVTFTTVDIDGTTGSGLGITNNTNAVNINGGTIGATNDPAGIGVDVNSGSGDVTVAAAITKTTPGDIVEVSGRTGGTVTFSGNLSATGAVANGIDVTNNTGGTTTFSGATKTLNTGTNTAVNLATNTGHTINFTSGGLDIDTTSGTGFNATNSGTVSVQGTGNTVTTGTGTSINVVNTTIGSIAGGPPVLNTSAGTFTGNFGMTFQSVNANGATNGIIFNNAGSGGFNITGTGTTDGSGGTIQNTNEDGIQITNTNNILLSNLNLTRNAQSSSGTFSSVFGGNIAGYHAALKLTTVDNLVLNNLNIDGGETGAGINNNNGETGISGQTVSDFFATNVIVENFGDAINESNVQFQGLTGTVGLTNFTSQDTGGGLFSIQNTTGNLTMNVNNGTFRDTVNGVGRGGLEIDLAGTGNTALTVINSTFGNGTRPLVNGGLQGTALSFDVGGTQIGSLTVQDSSFSGVNVGISGTLDLGSNPQLTLNIGDGADADTVGNTITNVRSLGINIFTNGNLTTGQGLVNATISNNVIGTPNVSLSGSELGSGLRIVNEGGSTVNALINNNTIQSIGDSTPGIQNGFEGMILRESVTSGISNFTVTNNSFINIYDDRALQIAQPSGAGIVCSNISGNSFSGTIDDNNPINGTTRVIRVRQTSGTHNVTQTNQANLGTANGLQSGNITVSGTINFGASPCPTP